MCVCNLYFNSRFILACNSVSFILDGLQQSNFVILEKLFCLAIKKQFSFSKSCVVDVGQSEHVEKNQVPICPKVYRLSRQNGDSLDRGVTRWPAHLATTVPLRTDKQ